MKALVTGATGFVGAAVARALLAAGWPVRALVRPSSDRRNLAGLALECALGDLTEIGSLERALAGCSALFHVAADYRLWVRRPGQLLRSNLEGTRNLLQAAAARRRRAHRLHQQRGDARLALRWRARRRERYRLACRYGR